MPDLKSDNAKSDILLEGRAIVKTFRGGFGGRPYRALDHAELALFRGETLGLMGPSGCGKAPWPGFSFVSSSRTAARCFSREGM